MKITGVHIKRFRGFQNESFEMGTQLTAIAGQNGTQKSTLLGIITQTFTIKKDDPMRNEKPLCGGNYISGFRDKFRLSPVFDKPKGHEWTISFDENLPNFTVESIARSEAANIRFWKKGARKAGDGYLSYPTIFLSLKRLVPIAEELNIKTNDGFLTDEELNKFKQLHNKILITTTPISSATVITSKNKDSIGVTTDSYDWNQNSMGQDNLGKIILALFSFERLKKRYPDQYKGGILAIDELDATMYPASQVELLKILRQYASRLMLQIVFTTHSLFLLEEMNNMVKKTADKAETKNQIKIIYLKRKDDRISIKQDVNYEDILLNLKVMAKKPINKRSKITTYTEDNETKLFVKALLKAKASRLGFVDVPLSCGVLEELVHKKIPAFSSPQSIVILDGDVKNHKDQMKLIKNADNVLILPGDKSLERMLAGYLKDLSDNNDLWSKLSNGYTKQVCFRDINYEQICSSGEQGRQKAKTWFNSQLPYWGRDGYKVLNPFCASIQAEVDKFVSAFEKTLTKFI